MEKKKLRIYLANLGIEVPVHKHHPSTNQVTILTKDVPEKIRRNVGLGGTTAKYWYGEDAGGNKLITGDEESEETIKAREFTEAAAKGIIDIADGMRKLIDGKLNKRAIVILIVAAAPPRTITQEQVDRVLTTISELDKTFLKK